jgi:hypothetical protein
VEGLLARLVDDLAIVEHGAIDENHASRQTQATGQHTILDGAFSWFVVNTVHDV